MPLREYQCDACGHRFEVIQKMSDPPLEVCPRCGDVVHKLQAAPAFHLKGTGWYVTDYAKKDQSSESKMESDSKKDSDSKKENDSKKESDSKKDGDSKKDSRSKNDSRSKESASGSTDKAETKKDTARSTGSTESGSSGPSNPSSTKNS
jgi:putative FmdB family regulatory protein